MQTETTLRKYYFRRLLSGSAWLHNVCLELTPSGTISSLLPDTLPPSNTPQLGTAIPGMPNVHSHAFQRGFAGLSEFTSGATEESFWTWRELMYKFSQRLAPEMMSVIACQAYIQMLKTGYTSVGEFHYLHNKCQDKALEMAQGIIKAADIAGISLTLLPVLYQVADFGKDSPNELQKGFVHTNEDFMRLIKDLEGVIREPNVLGMAFHSLRAVPINHFKEVLDFVKSRNPKAPVHIHISEQVKEVESCVAMYGKPPIEFLFEKVNVDSTWCLVHATQANQKEQELIKESGCLIGICPTTEANLGDGVFPAKKYQQMKGDGLCVGSDSNICIDPVEELRQLEYSQRLWEKARVVVRGETRHNGTDLWISGARNGAKALWQPVGSWWLEREQICQYQMRRMQCLQERERRKCQMQWCLRVEGMQ